MDKGTNKLILFDDLRQSECKFMFEPIKMTNCAVAVVIKSVVSHT